MPKCNASRFSVHKFPMLRWGLKILALSIDMFRSLFQLLVIYLPGNFGNILRQIYWSKKLKKLGKGCRIDPGVYFYNPEWISIGDNCWIDNGVMILAGPDQSSREKKRIKIDALVGQEGNVIIGNNVHVGLGSVISGIDSGIWIEDNCCISTGCRLYGMSHHYRSYAAPYDQTICFGSMPPPEKQCLKVGGIHLGTNVGVALGCTLLSGTDVGENSFITPMSFIKSGIYSSNSMISGNPAIRIGERFERQRATNVP